MPLGASRLTLLAFQASVTAEAEIVRKKIGVGAVGTTQIDTAQYKFSGSSALFDGNSDYLITSGDIGDKIGEGDYTAECFIRYNTVPPSGSSYSKIFDNRRAAFGTFGWQLYTDGSSYVVSYRGTGSTTNAVINQSATISTGTWYHLALVKKDTTLTLYVDGAELGNVSITNTTYADSNEDLWIGCGHNVADFVDGHIDQVRISNTARYTRENFQPNGFFANDDNTLLLLQMHGTDGSTFFNDENSNVTTEFNEDDYAGSLKLAVPFDDVNGVNDVSKDITGTGITSAASVTQGASSVVSGGAYWSTYNSSLINNRDGAALVYTLPSTMPSSTSGTYVVEAWLRATDATSNSNWCFSSADVNGRWLQGINSTGSTDNSTYKNLGDTDWHHFAMVCNGGTKSVYIDAIYKSAFGTSNTGFDDLHIGQFNAGDSNDFKGQIQDLRVYQGTNKGYTGTDASNPNFALPKPIVKKDPQSVNIIGYGNAQIDTAKYQFGNSSVKFDGSGDYLEVHTSQDYSNYKGPFTMELWFNAATDTGSVTSTLMSNRSGGYGSKDFMFLYRNFDNKVNIPYKAFNGTTNEDLVGGFSSVITNNTWNHVAFGYDGNNVYSTWLNGTRFDTDTATYTDHGLNLDEFWIGSQDAGSLPFNAGGDGHIDEVRISLTDRYGASNSSFTVPTEPFIPDNQTLFLFHANGTDAQTDFIADTGVTRAQVSQNAVGNTQISTTQNQFGGASAVFDGSGDYLISNGPNLGAGEWSIEMWARFDSVGGVRVLYDDRESANTASGTILLYTNGTTLYFNSQQVNKISGGTLATNTWYHIAVTRDSSNDVRMFLDGTEIGTSYNDTSTFAQLDGDAFFGMNHQSPNNHYFDGYLDEVRFSNTARYTANFTTPTEQFQNDGNTLLLLHMDGSNSSTTIIDDNGKEAS